MQEITTELDRHNEPSFRESVRDDDLAAIIETEELISDFVKISEKLEAEKKYDLHLKIESVIYGLKNDLAFFRKDLEQWL